MIRNNNQTFYFQPRTQKLITHINFILLNLFHPKFINFPLLHKNILNSLFIFIILIILTFIRYIRYRFHIILSPRCWFLHNLNSCILNYLYLPLFCFLLIILKQKCIQLSQFTTLLPIFTLKRRYFSRQWFYRLPLLDLNFISLLHYTVYLLNHLSNLLLSFLFILFSNFWLFNSQLPLSLLEKLYLLHQHNILLLNSIQL